MAPGAGACPLAASVWPPFLVSQFITKFENKMNQLDLTKIVETILRTYEDGAAATAFVDATLEKKARLGPEATLYLEILRLGIELRECSGAAPPPEGATMSDGDAAVAALDARAATLAGIKKALGAKKVEVDALSGLMDT